MKNIVFIGNSAANIKAIEEIRKTDATSSITLVSSDAFYPYDRNALFGYLAKEIKEKQVLCHPDAFYKQNNIRVIVDQPVARFNFKRNQVVLENKEQLEYDILVLADIASPRLPEIKGNHKAGVYNAARLASVKSIAEQLPFVETVVVQVSSVLGFQTLCALGGHGKELVAVSSSASLLPEVLDEESASILKQLLEQNGVRLMLDNSIEEILGDSDLKAVRLKSGKVLSTEMVILDGLSLDTRPIKESGLEFLSDPGRTSFFQSNFKNVYLVDAFLHTFKDSGAGDYTASREQLQAQGLALAQEILGQEVQEVTASPVVRFKMKDLSGFWFGATCLQEGGREFLNFDSSKNIYKKIYTSDAELSGAVFLNADDQYANVLEIFQQKINIQGAEEKLLEDHFNIQELTKIGQP